MKLKKDMEQVFYNWCKLLYIEKDYGYIKEFYKDIFNYYNIPIYKNSKIKIDQNSGSGIDILCQIKENDVLITQISFKESNFISFVNEINTNLRLKYEINIGM